MTRAQAVWIDFIFNDRVNLDTDLVPTHFRSVTVPGYLNNNVAFTLSWTMP